MYYNAVMKNLAVFLSLLSICCAQIKKSESTFLKNDQDVIFIEDLTAEKIVFDVIENRPVFFTKQGNNKLASIQKGAKAELIAFDDRAYKIKTKGRNGNIVGWVSPHALSCNDPDFISNFKKVYERQIIVNQYIRNEEVTIGMTPEEVIASLGEPTKTSLRRTNKGDSGRFEYIETYEQKHYAYFRDPRTGQSYKKLSHVTEEIKSKTVIDFENHAVSAIEESIDNSIRKRPSIVTRPIYLDYRGFLLF